MVIPCVPVTNQILGICLHNDMRRRLVAPHLDKRKLLLSKHWAKNHNSLFLQPKTVGLHRLEPPLESWLLGQGEAPCPSPMYVLACKSLINRSNSTHADVHILRHVQIKRPHPAQDNMHTTSTRQTLESRRSTAQLFGRSLGNFT